eukprot:m.459592 g.459592  ORF g.459592 m.459592 type:complete len:51 (-) comp21583_c0_seq22:853-1005(-)
MNSQYASANNCVNISQVEYSCIHSLDIYSQKKKTPSGNITKLNMHKYQSV